jgi:hypothetical protein
MGTVVDFNQWKQDHQPPKRLEWWTDGNDVVIVCSADDDFVSYHENPNAFGTMALNTFLEQFKRYSGDPPKWWKPSMVKGSAYSD